MIKLLYEIDNKIIEEIEVVNDLHILTQEVFENFFIQKGLRPACYPICIKYINELYEKGDRIFEFYPKYSHGDRFQGYGGIAPVQEQHHLLHQ